MTAHQDVENPLRLVFVEEWADTEALFSHFAVPASRDFVKSIRVLVNKPPTLNIYDATPIQMWESSHCFFWIKSIIF